MSEGDHELETEQLIHNGEILSEPEGVKTVPLPATFRLPGAISTPPVEDINPDVLAGLMAGIISAAFNESPPPSPMEIVSRLLMLKTENNHKVVWTRFDINQLFALWTNKLDRQRIARGSNRG